MSYKVIIRCKPNCPISLPVDVQVDADGSRKLIVAVKDAEHRRPQHFHVFRNEQDRDAWKNGACLCFKDSRYFRHWKNRETLTEDELSALVTKLRENADRKTFPVDTNWELLILAWNMVNPDRSINLNTPMPEYDYQTIQGMRRKRKWRNS